MLTNESLKMVVKDVTFGIGNYICHDDIFQSELLEVADLIIGYCISDHVKSPLNFFIEAMPGSGKSYLVKEMTKAVEENIGSGKIEYIYCNLTTITSIDDLNMFFWRAQSASIQSKTPVIFFDEVDSRFQSIDNFYSYFLMPMFDGCFFAGGRQHDIGTVVLFFAASKKIWQILSPTLQQSAKIRLDGKSIPVTQYIDNQKNLTENAKDIFIEGRGNPEVSPKLLDFLNRIDYTIYVPPVNSFPNASESLCQEQARYMIISFINKYHPHAKFIYTPLLQMLSVVLIGKNNPRQIGSLIKRCAIPTDGIFTKDGLPSELAIDSITALIKKYEKKMKKGEHRWYRIIDKENIKTRRVGYYFF